MSPISAPTLIELTAEIRQFVDDRDWKQFHNSKELALAISVEAGELLQHFVWKSAAQSEERVREKKEEVASEMADVAILLLELANHCEVDLGAAIRQKLAKNAERYPVEKARGSNRKYNEL